MLNKEAAGVSPESLKKLDEILKRELESLNIDMPMVEINLNQTVQQLKEIINRNPYMSYEERMKTLYTYVNDLFSVKDPLLYTEDFPLMPMKIGDIIASGAGVCRHTALVAKLLGDEIGLNISLVRGKTSGGHIWNEVILPNGKKYLFDATKRALIDVESKDPFLSKYSFNGRKLYT